MEPETTATTAAVMTWTAWDALPVLAALLAGIVGKQFGERPDVMGNLPAQKVTAPTASVLAASIAVSLVAQAQGLDMTEVEISTRAGISAGLAIGAWSTGKNALQFLKAWRARRRARHLQKIDAGVLGPPQK
ncbi:MAG TPA: hypothetical protein DC063_10060 [Arenimonas sp.]|nr:hypothetical protein [Candidatus Rokubacteria bacterium]HBD20378.1 hypothetical protein [Arenimonas sp.]